MQQKTLYYFCYCIGTYRIVLSWIPVASQNGPQGFCAAAVDSTNVQSEQWCIMFLVGYRSPDIVRPTAVQGSASPLGTVFQNQSTFSIQSNYYIYLHSIFIRLF